MMCPMQQSVYMRVRVQMEVVWHAQHGIPTSATRGGCLLTHAVWGVCSVMGMLGFNNYISIIEECCTCCVGLPIYHKGGCLLTQCDMTTLLLYGVFWQIFSFSECGMFGSRLRGWSHCPLTFRCVFRQGLLCVCVMQDVLISKVSSQ